MAKAADYAFGLSACELPRLAPTFFHLIDIKAANFFGHMMAWLEPAAENHPTMQKFALKFLLTTLMFRRRSNRLDGAQLVVWLLTTFMIVFVGIYAWVHGPY